MIVGTPHARHSALTNQGLPKTDELASPGERMRAFAVIAIMIVVVALAWTARGFFVGPSATFFGAYGAILITTELITAIVLILRARRRRSARAAILAAAYAFAWPLIVANVVALPATSGQTFSFQIAPWMWSLWHMGWAALICTYAWSEERRPPRVWWLPIGLAVATALGLIAFGFGAHQLLPTLLLADNSWSPVQWGVYLTALAIDVAALVGMVRRIGRVSDLDLWVTIAVAAACGEVFIVALSLVRFSIGSYVGRILSVISGLAVLVSVIGGYVARARRAGEREQQAAIALANAERDSEFYALGDAVPQILWTATADGSIDWYNQRWYDYTGQTPAEAAGWGWQAVHHPEDFPKVVREWTGAIERGTSFEMEFRLRGADGVFRWFLTRIHPYRNASGAVVRWFGTNTDIDNQRRTAERTQRVAEILQDVFLPQTLPQHERVALDATYWAAESDAVVGGDWYDAFLMADGRLLLSIGDVAGHGLDAAVVAGRLRQSIFTQALENQDPAQVLVVADRVLRAQSDTIATALLAYFDPRDGSLVYASAGHPAPIVAMPAHAEWLPGASDAPLGTGFVTGGTLEVHTHRWKLVPQAVLALYTDGVIEYARNLDDGEERLRQALQAIATPDTPLDAQAVLTRVFAGKHPPDDVALLLVRWGETNVQAMQPAKPLLKHWRFHSSHAQSAHAARLELTGFLREHAAFDCDLYNTELILGELLANTVEHAPGLVEVLIDWTGAAPLLRLRDSGPGLAELKPTLPTELLDEDGRGLFLVRTFAERFEMRAAPGFGTEFTVGLPLRRRPIVSEQSSAR